MRMRDPEELYDECILRGLLLVLTCTSNNSLEMNACASLIDPYYIGRVFETDARILQQI
jgi:hypothetical protein